MKTSRSTGAGGEAAASIERCSTCGSASLLLSNGLCPACLLKTGLAPIDEDSETLEAGLAAINLRDADWRIGNYQIMEEIGRGGMGVIYRARQRHSRRIVALKRIAHLQADCRGHFGSISPRSGSRREPRSSEHPANLRSQRKRWRPIFQHEVCRRRKRAERGSLFAKSRARIITMLAKVARAVPMRAAREFCTAI